MLEIIQSDVFSQWLRGLKDRRARMRIHYGPGYRLYYMHREMKVVMLCGGDKPAQPRDIENAKIIAKEWRD